MNKESNLYLICEGYKFKNRERLLPFSDGKVKCLVNISPKFSFIDFYNKENSYVKNELKLDSISKIEKVDQVSFYRLDYDIVRIEGENLFEDFISFKLVVDDSEDFKKNISSLVVSEKIVS